MNDNASSIISKVWSFCNTLRDGGVNEDRGTSYLIISHFFSSLQN